ncbi:hypothetical protein NKH71_32910 [Mesorhizobium sp. M0983]|uniref:hypothetical protein n=1 Tax=Mesorhizobium sp. M0983 TaxID=2957040 RepID=UPI003338637F
MIPKNGNFSPAPRAFPQALTGLNPPPADPVSTIGLASFPDNVPATDGPSPQKPWGTLGEQLPETRWELAESSLTLEEDFSGQAWRIVAQFRGDLPPASPDEHDAPTRAGSLVVPADEDAASATYPQTNAHPRQDLSLAAMDEALPREGVQQLLELSPQPLAGPSHSTAGFPAVDGGAREKAEDYEEALGILRKHLPETFFGVPKSMLAEGRGLL